MNVRSAAALAVALATIGGAAQAAPVKKVCNNVVDPKGDTFVARPQDAQAAYGPQEDALDIVSADIASDAKVVTAAIRVVSMGAAQTSPYGKGYAFDFMIPSSPMVITLRAILPGGGVAPTFEASYKDPEVPNSPSTFLGVATGVVDEKKKEVRISAPVSLFSSLGEIKKGTLLSPPEDSSASVGRAVPVTPGIAGQATPTRFAFADVALEAKPYKVGTPSCVTPGK